MQKFLKNIRLWLPTIVVLLAAAFTIVRLQTVQAALCKQIESKVNRAVYQTDRENRIRELDLVHESLKRIEEKLDNAIHWANKTDPCDAWN